MAKRNNDIVVEVMGGPNKWDLIFESFINGKKVEFSICFPAEYSSRRLITRQEVRILGLHKMEKAGKWIVYGILVDSFGNLKENIGISFRDCNFPISIPDGCFNIYFTGEYETHSRYGKIRLILPDADLSNKEAVILPEYLSSALQS